jgi:hypothetical protein
MRPIVMSQKKCDTLWDISGRYLDSPGAGKRFGRPISKSKKNPDLIYPDDILILCVIQGKT